MTKGWAPPYWLSLASDSELWRAPTLNELEGLELEFTQWRLAHPEAMSPELWWKLDRLIGWQTVHRYPWTRQQIQLMRWRCVREGRDRLGLSWPEAYEYARDTLTGSPAEAGADMMKVSYDQMQQQLPPEQRRQRTYKRRKR